MLSVIICSVNAVALAAVKKNIGETIGVPHEVIAIDNTTNRYSICKAYNEGASMAKYPILCFMHEDIAFETCNWGQRVCDHLANERTGLLGVAGGDTKSLVPSSWSIPVISNEINLVQHYKADKGKVEHILVTNPKTTGVKKQVTTLDGVWLCTRKDVFEQFRFDDKTFTGFHGYDIDYSLQVGTKYNLYVVFDIVLHHYSEGTPDQRWIDSALLISKKWKDRLPRSVHTLSAADYNWHHWHSMRVYLQHLFRLKYSYVNIVRSYLFWSFTKYFTIRRFLSMGKYVVMGIFGAKTE